MRIAALAPVLIMALAGCVHKRPTSEPPHAPAPQTAPAAQLNSPKPPPATTPSASVDGKVASVSAVGRFVVLNYPIGHLPVRGLQLNVYRNGAKVGQLQVSGPQMDDNVVADILAGEIQRGDVARPE